MSGTSSRDTCRIKFTTSFVNGASLKTWLGFSSVLLKSFTEAILAHAERRFPVEPVRTSDAIHLATADPPALVTIVTRDVRVRDNANASGYPVE